jgi:succinate dehydrogenase/fumarate reductase flavoprotein subunit
MSIVDSLWSSPADAEDERRRSNYQPIEELEALSRQEYDFVVVGGGGSGATAAIEAADRGASVLILEKTTIPGGSTLASGGTIRLVSDQAGTVEHFWQLSQGATPRDVVEAFVAGLAELPHWVQQHGGELVVREEREGGGGDHARVFPISRPGSSFPNFPSADSLAPRALLRSDLSTRKTGEALWDFLAANLAERRVPLVLGARVVRLLQDFPARRVVGVEVEVPGGLLSVRARQGVILCSGGYAFNDELMREHFGLPLPTVCPPGRATGDGVRLAQDVGADLWHMGATAASVGYRPSELLAGFQCKMPSYGFVMVDQVGHRYVAETSLENHSAVLTMLAQDPLTGEYLRTPSYVIFDETTRLSGTVAHLPHGANRRYPWSSDNSEEVRRGWIKRADSLDELAEQLGLPVDALHHTIDEFNGCASRGDADALGRTPELMHPIVAPPFYGAEVFPIIVNTQGGPRRDARGQILRADGLPIPGLYGAGELGSMWNRLYPGAGNICEALVSGRLAVQSALEAVVLAR